MSLTCQYCTNTYVNKSSLIHHQKTSKKCLRIQQKEYIPIFKCSGCTRTFTRKEVYSNHIDKCVPYVEIQLSEEYEFQLIEKDEELQIKEEEICELREEIKKLLTELAKRPVVNITNNNTTNIKDCVIVAVTPELFQKHKHNLTNDHVDAGAFGMARYAADEHSVQHFFVLYKKSF